MSERVTDARLRELAAAQPDRMGGTLIDTLLLRELAAEILAARTPDAAAERAARGQAWALAEAQGEVAVLRARLAAAEGGLAEISAALGQDGPRSARTCVALIGLIGRTCARLTDERNEAVRALAEERRMWTRPTMEPHP